jgi:beta-lactamase class D
MKLVTTCLLAVVLFASCSENVEIDKSLGKYFDDNKVEGCFALMNNGTGI